MLGLVSVLFYVLVLGLILVLVPVLVLVLVSVLVPVFGSGVGLDSAFSYTRVRTRHV